MKRIIVAFLLGLNIGIAYGADKTITSLSYVTNQLATKQDEIPAVDTNTVITHTGTAGDIGEKGIYDSTGNYAEQQTSLVTAGDANTGISTALENEFICIEEDTDGTCLIWRIAQASLPNGYTQLEYIESTGTQYIDTGVLPSYTDCVYSKLFVTSVDTQYRALFGASPDGESYRFYVSAGNGVVWFANSSCGGTNILLNKLANVEVCLTPQETGTLKVTTENNSITKSTAVRLSSGHSIKLFTRNTTEPRSKLKLYSFVLKRDLNDTILNLIPARRNSDGKLGMYDTVSNTFFTNQGSGEFIGPNYLPSGN